MDEDDIEILYEPPGNCDLCKTKDKSGYSFDHLEKNRTKNKINMDTGNLINPFFPTNLPKKLEDEIYSNEEEDFTYEVVYDKEGNGKYNLIVEFDTRPMKTYGFYRELLAKEQDRTQDPHILANLLPMIIRNVRVWRVWESWESWESFGNS